MRPMASAPPPARRRVLLVAAAVSVVAVLALPRTRPDSVRQFRRALPVARGMPAADDARAARREAALSRIAAEHPDDPALQIAYALTTHPDDEAAALRPLLDRFPDDPTTHAAFLIYALRHQGSDPVAEAVRVADRGSLLEPDNAFFPAMRAAALIETRNSQARIAALRDASRRARWEDHSQTIMEGLWQLQDPGTGLNAGLRADQYYAFPLNAFLLSATGMSARDAAAALEKAGRWEEGLRIRLDLIRLGDLIRAQAHRLNVAQVGVRMMDIAIQRPADPGPPAFNNVDWRLVRPKERAGFLARLRQHGYASEAKWVEGRFAAWDASMEILEGGLQQYNATAYLWWLVGLNSLAVILLGGALWLSALGLLARSSSRAAGIRDGKPLRPAMTYGIALAVLAAALLTPVAVRAPAGGLGLLSVVAVAALILGRNRPGLRAFGGALLLLAVPVALLADVLRLAAQQDGSAKIVGVSPVLLAATDHPILGLAVPALAAAWLAIGAAFRRRPVSVAVVRGFSRAMPAVALLLVLWAVSVNATAYASFAQARAFTRQAEHEAGVYADAVGRTWPD